MALAEARLLYKRRRPGFGAGVMPPASPSAMSLVKALVNLAQLVAMSERPKVCQRRNAANLARRVNLLSPLFEEIRDSRPPLPPSAVLAFRELYTTMQRIKLLLDDVREGSCLWLLMENDAFGEQFQEVTQELGTELEKLPLELLEISHEVREQVELVRMQILRAKVFVDTSEDQLKEEMLVLLSAFERKEIPNLDQLRILFEKLQIFNSKDCRRELHQLDEELSNMLGNSTGHVLESVTNLISFARYSKCVLFGVSDVDEMEDSWRDSSESDGGEVSTTGRDANAVNSSLNPPDEFRCPISLDLMLDPVIVATGQTYDRTSIGRWLEAGSSTCPKSGQKLLHVSLIPNYALRSLISQWCEDHNVPFGKPDKGNKTCGGGVDHIATTRAGLDATKMTAAFLVGKLATGSPEVQRQVAYELRLLAKCGMENRMCIAEAGAIPFLVPLLSSQDSKTQENAVTALLNLSIYDNNKLLIMASGALDSIIEVLQRGSSMEARENAAATLFSLSVFYENKVAIGSKPSAIPALIDLLRDGSLRGKQDAITALCNLAGFHDNKTRVIEAGAVPLLVSLLAEEWAGITDVLGVLALLAASQQGLIAISEASPIPLFVGLLRTGSPRGKEYATALLLALCRGIGDQMILSVLKINSSVSSLYTLLTMGTPRAKRRANSLLKILHRWEPPMNTIISSTVPSAL